MNWIIKFITSRFDTIPLSGYMYFIPKPPPMKTKLLNQIRKHYSYYINDKGDYVVIDHFSKKVLVMDLNYFQCKYGRTPTADLETYIEGHRLYEVKKHILGAYGYPSNRKLYRKATNIYNRYMKSKQLNSSSR